MADSILTPGWAGALGPDELETVRAALRRDRDLAYAWGFQRRRRTFPAALVQRIALHGDPDARGPNAAIVRQWREGLRAARTARNGASPGMPRLSAVA